MINPTNPNLTYDDATHIYKIDGERVPSITQVLGASNIQDDAYWSEESAERGRRVHKAIELDIKDRLRPVDDLDSHTKGCLLSWWKFRGDNPGEVVATETKLCDPVLRFAGRMDILYQWEGELCSGSRFGVIDIKTGQAQDWHALQTAAQVRLVLANQERVFGYPSNIRSLRRTTLYLNKTGYKVSVHTDPNDWAVFQSALTLAHWRNTNGKCTGS